MNTMRKSIYIKTITKLMTMNKKNLINLCILSILVNACSLTPGMHLDAESNWLNNNSSVYVESLNKEILIVNINDLKVEEVNYDYRIGKGDQIAITIWGLEDIFPLSNINQDQNLRRVDSNGDIFFPYVGIIKAEGKTQNELRSDISETLSNFFKSPQLDLSIVKFNSQRVFLLGEVGVPQKINITDIPLSLSEALGQSKGINNNTAEGSEVFVIRQGNQSNPPKIFRVDLSSPSGFLGAGNFYLRDNDIVYVNAKNTTRWNRVISQFFPFSSFINSIDNLTNKN